MSHRQIAIMTYKSDSYYIGKVLEGDLAGFGQLVDKHRNRVFNLAFRICGNREDAEEIAQDSFLKIYHSIGTFRNHAAFSTWLYRIVYNTSISFLRSNKNPMLPLEDSAEGKAGIAELIETDEEENAESRKAILNFALQKLSADERGIISLHYYEEMSIEEISNVTGMSKSNVKIKLFRSRKKLLEMIEFAEKNTLVYYEAI